jgi:thiol peroxidase
MATTNFKGTPVQTAGDIPDVGSQAPAFELWGTDLQPRTLDSWAGKKKVLNIFPSIDTPVCAASLHAFSEQAGGREDTVVVNISADLPFAFKRFCSSGEGMTGVESCSTAKSTFGTDYGVKMIDGVLEGLMARVVLVLDENNTVTYREVVSDIGHEPNYQAALDALEAIPSA